ncbi:hypothetical protein N8328_00575 [Crocinitomicaceae bacterium]|nr:hypothetical protein [Crocinitomicaceae bacterium]
MTISEFSSLSILKKLQLLKEKGEFVGNRQVPSYTVSLFAFSGFFAEVHILKNLNQVQWIEIQNNKQILAEYTNDIDLNELLD